MSSEEPSILSCIRVEHGKLSIQVSRIIFIGPEATIDDNRWKLFQNTLNSRYPWLT